MPAVSAVDVSAAKPVSAPPFVATCTELVCWKFAGRPSEEQLVRTRLVAGRSPQSSHGSVLADRKPVVAPRNCSNSAGARNDVPYEPRSDTHCTGVYSMPIL